MVSALLVSLMLIQKSGLSGVNGKDGDTGERGEGESK